jgi:hypothetical protein
MKITPRTESLIAGLLFLIGITLVVLALVGCGIETTCPM